MLRPSLQVAFFTSCSRVLGLIREMLFAHVFGASWMSDVFLVAFKFPNFFRRFFAEGAFHATFVPPLSEALQKNKDEAFTFVRQTAMILGSVLLLIVIIVECIAPYLTFILAPGYTTHSPQWSMAVTLIRLMFPYAFFICMASLWASVLNTIGKFGWASASAIILNVVMIGALIFPSSTPVYTLSFGVLLAGIIQMVFLYYLCRRDGFGIRLTKITLTPTIRSMIKRMGPGMIGAGAMQINVLIDQTLATFLSAGSLTYLYCADRFNQLPLAVLGISIGTVLLPTLSRCITQKDWTRVAYYQEKSYKIGMDLSIPAAFGLCMLSHDIIELFYGHGRFSAEDVHQTAPTLFAYAIGLPAYVLSKIYSTTFFAYKDTKTPLKVTLFSIGLNFLLNLGLMLILNHVGLALATSISSWISVLVFRFLLIKKNLLCPKKNPFSIIFTRVGLSIPMVIAVAWVGPFFSHQHSFWYKGASILIKLLVGILVYIIFYGIFHKIEKNFFSQKAQ